MSNCPVSALVPVTSVRLLIWYTEQLHYVPTMTNILVKTEAMVLLAHRIIVVLHRCAIVVPPSSIQLGMIVPTNSHEFVTESLITIS
jgi:hypothetical protein